ncbi:MAG: type I phosphomannose isomerase catalytic subunit [Trueperaceae bacterium]
MTDRDPMVAPLLLAPRFERRVWGGGRLGAWVAQPARNGDGPDGDGPDVHGPTGEPVGECWLAGDDNRVVGGPYAGRALRDVVAALGEHLIGSVAHGRYGARMPLLAKLLDAAADLSVQVHPDDAYALAHERASGHLGKSEAWYVLDAAPGAAVLWGFRRDVTADEVREAVRKGMLPALMHRIEVRRGDVVVNPAGTVHAILAGVVAFEIQQASDLTYRLYDHGRVGADGRPRALHLDKALAVAHLEGALPNLPRPRTMTGGWRRLVEAPEFTMDVASLDDGAPDGAAGVTAPESLEILTLLAGAGALRTGAGDVSLAPGATVVLPAALGAYRVMGQGEVIRCAVVKAWT